MRRLLACVAALLALHVVSCSDDPPTAPLSSPPSTRIDAPYSWAVGPIPGLTTAWHPAPGEVVVPVGTTLRMKCAAARSLTVEWTGAVEVERDDQASYAECPVHVAGRSEVQVRIGTAGGGAQGGGKKPPLNASAATNEPSHTCTVVGVDVAPDAIHVAEVVGSVDPHGLTDASTNDETMRVFFGGGERFQMVSGLTRVSATHYRTAAGRRVRFTARVEPAAFASMMEWRIPGRRAQLGSFVERVFPGVGKQAVSVGPPAGARAVTLETYAVTIRRDVTSDGIAQDGRPVTFRAKTTPRGYENEVTWIASTKFGHASPVVGHGAVFTTIFEHTFGAGLDGQEWQWLGVRADDAAFNQDQKFFLGPAEAFEVSPIDASALPAYPIVVLQTPLPYAPQVPADQEMLVAGFTDATFTLSYTAIDHQPQQAISHGYVDNVTRALYAQGPVSTLANLFPTLPVPALPGPSATLAVTFERPILFDVAIAQEAVKAVKWKLDDGSFLPGGDVTTDFDPDSPDLTADQEKDKLGELKRDYGLPDTTRAALKRVAKPKDSFNCHGFTFLWGLRWFNRGVDGGKNIRDIISKNGYGEVGGATGKKVKEGDIVVYEKNGQIMHSGRVSKVDANGNPTKIESKWGNLGTYEHAPDNVPNYMGTPKYYHTDRANGNCVTQVAC